MTDTKRLQAGSKAPLFTLPDQDDKKAALKDFAGQWVIVYFYPKDNTPGCTTEACDFTDNLRTFNKLNTTVLGISRDSAESHRKFIEKQNLKITLLSDTDHKVMDKYGAWGIKKLYGKESEGVIRSTFIIDPTGKIAHAWYSVKATGHVEKVKEKLAELVK